MIEGLGTGLYRIGSVAKLAQSNRNTVNRWIAGYTFKDRKGDTRRSKPLFEADLPIVNGRKALSFHDLVDILWVKAFLGHGVSLHAIRKAATRMVQITQERHPFCKHTFLTDGRTIFAQFRSELEDGNLLDLVTSQYAFEELVAPFLRVLDYEKDVAARWWPLDRSHKVLVDPGRSLGAPIVERGVPTSILYGTFKAENENAERVAWWYEVSVAEVNDAVAFEQRMAA